MWGCVGRKKRGGVSAEIHTAPPHSRIQLRGRLLFFWFALILAATFFLPDRVWNTLLIGIGGMWLIALFWASQLAHHLSASRQVRSGWVAVGDRLQETFLISNASTLPALWVEVVDGSTVPGYRTGVVRSIRGAFS